MAKFKWTEKRTARLMELRGTMTISQIARTMGTTTRSIKTKLTMMKKNRTDHGYRANPPAGTEKIIWGRIMKFDGRNWKQIGWI